jgi:hypothetical protein
MSDLTIRGGGKPLVANYSVVFIVNTSTAVPREGGAFATNGDKTTSGRKNRQKGLSY